MLLALIENDSETVASGSREALTVARGLSAELDEPLHAAVFGSDGADTDALSAHGVSTLYLIDEPFTAEYSPECWGAALGELIEHSGATGVIAAASERGNELMAHAAARANAAFASNCVAVDAGQQWRLTRVRGGGMLLEDAELDSAVKFVSVAPGSVEPVDSPTPLPTTTEQFVPEHAGTVPHSTFVERTSRGSGVSLSNARVIVSGGRGVGSAEAFSSLEELASLLGGAVGCSRVATNSGWRPHADQVGQTGTKIVADLYIACGISGATQHWVGCMGAKTILAINTDPEAPLVTRSDYAVIGDLHAVLPAVIERIKARKQLETAV